MLSSSLVLQIAISSVQDCDLQEAAAARRRMPAPSDSSTPVGVIVAVVIAVILLIVLCALCVLLLWRRRKSAKMRQSQNGTQVEPAESVQPAPTPPLPIMPAQSLRSEAMHGSAQGTPLQAPSPIRQGSWQSTNASGARKYSFSRGNDSVVSAGSDAAAPLQGLPSVGSNLGTAQAPRQGWMQDNSSMTSAEGEMAAGLQRPPSVSSAPGAGGASFASAASGRPPLRLLVSSDPETIIGSTAVNTSAVSNAEGDMAGLECALDNLAAQRPPGLLMDRFAILRARVHGGQALVQMARDHPDGYFQFAIKCAPSCRAETLSCLACTRLGKLLLLVDHIAFGKRESAAAWHDHH